MTHETYLKWVGLNSLGKSKNQCYFDQSKRLIESLSCSDSLVDIYHAIVYISLVEWKNVHHNSYDGLHFAMQFIKDSIPRDEQYCSKALLKFAEV